MRTVTFHARHAAILGAVLALATAACTSSATPSPVASPSQTAGASVAPSTTEPSAAPESPATTDQPTSQPSSGPSPSLGACPSLPMDLATVRDLVKADRAIKCFSTADITFKGYVPTTDGLGGVPASNMTPAWLANPFTGVILQPDSGDADQSAWFVVRVSPALGKCRVTAETNSKCPFSAYVDKFVTVTGHFNDPISKTCASAALPGETDAGPSKPKMVGNCRREFVVTAIAAG